MVLPTCKVAAEIQSWVRFPTGKEKKKSKKQSLGMMWPYFFFCIPTDPPGGHSTDGSAPLSAARGARLPFAWVPHSVGTSPALGTGTGAGAGVWRGGISGHHFELKYVGFW